LQNLGISVLNGCIKVFGFCFYRGCSPFRNNYRICLIHENQSTGATETAVSVILLAVVASRLGRTREVDGNIRAIICQFKIFTAC